MKKYLITLSVLSFVAVSAQEHIHTKYCGAHHKQQKLEAKFPQIKEAREKLDAQILQRKKSRLSSGKYVSNIAAANYTGQVYEIPVVVHIIESSATKNAKYKLTDDQIKTWIDNANKMYAGTYGNGYYSAGDNIGQSAVIPFKLVLAQRDPNCNATTGIIRYNGSTLRGYDDNGVNSEETQGVDEDDVLRLAPHWSESGYYNIYVVTTFDADTTNYGLMGYAYFPSTTDKYYHTFMKAAVVTNRNDSTLAHEFGHSLGLDHPFNGADSSGDECPPVTSGLTDAEACLQDNDKVCDTEPIQSLLSVSPTPNNSAINPCTNTNYRDTQYNIMNYTQSERKFTAGQRDRALEVFMETRKNLTLSNGGKAPDNAPSLQVNEPSCTVQVTDRGDWGIGPINVKLADIDNTTQAQSSAEYYIDYTKNSCISPNIKTDLQEGEEQTLSVSLYTNNPQVVKAWIDYNQDGVFSDDELIARSNRATRSLFTAKFTPRADAPKNTYLRLRVASDYQDFTPCLLDSGQVEDYAVRIVSQDLSVTDTATTKTERLAYHKAENKLVLENQKPFGDYQIYDMSGKLIRKGNNTTSEIALGNIPEGAYILKYQTNKTAKFIKN